MGARCIFSLTAVCIAASASMLYYLPAEKLWWIYPALALALASLLLLYRRIVMPSTAAKRGLELIAAQDFNNYLAEVGERNADQVVGLFNTIIAKLHDERIHNLEQENFLNLLLQASPMGMALLDFDHKISSVNASFLSITGIEKEADALGKNIEAIPSAFAAEMSRVPLHESRVIRQGGMRMWRCTHLHFIQTGFMRHFYLLEGLTEEVMQAERSAYEKVIRTMSHEVNNTMGGVKTVLDIIHDTCDDSDIREVIESCSDRCDKMCSFIRSYADVVKLPNAVRRPTDLALELRKLMPFLQGLAKEGVDIELQAPDGPVEADVDMPLMQQALVNIAKNAVESIGKEGYVRIKLEKLGKKAIIEVANNGAPISADTARQLFTPFFTTKHDGRGLGLTLISDILKKHNAEFRLCTGPDQITRFRIAL